MSDKETFTQIYLNNHWGSAESVSGEGSEFARTLELREKLPVLFSRYNINSVLDIGCGDFNWMKATIGDRTYMGVDIVDELIERNNKKYGTDKIRFSCRNIVDLTYKDFDGYDCIILRDVLVHLSLDSALAVLNQVRLGSIPYLFMTNFLGCIRNVDIPNGHWRPLNMFFPPFNMGSPTEIILSFSERYNLDGNDYLDKSVTMWRLEKIETCKHNSFCNDIVISELNRIAPLSVTDVGTGDGYWGKVTRLLFPKCQITGVEMSVRWYIHCVNIGVYDNMIQGCISEVMHILKGDVIILGDVLEHIEKDKALTVIEKATKQFKYVIINSPVGFQPQEHEDTEEIHRCGLTYDDFCNYIILSYHESGERTGEYKVFTILLSGNGS